MFIFFNHTDTQNTNKIINLVNCSPYYRTRKNNNSVFTTLWVSDRQRSQKNFGPPTISAHSSQLCLSDRRLPVLQNMTFYPPTVKAIKSFRLQWMPYFCYYVFGRPQQLPYANLNINKTASHKSFQLFPKCFSRHLKTTLSILDARCLTYV